MEKLKIISVLILTGIAFNAYPQRQVINIYTDSVERLALSANIDKTVCNFEDNNAIMYEYRSNSNLTIALNSNNSDSNKYWVIRPDPNNLLSKTHNGVNYFKDSLQVKYDLSLCIEKKKFRFSYYEKDSTGKVIIIKNTSFTFQLSPTYNTVKIVYNPFMHENSTINKAINHINITILNQCLQCNHEIPNNANAQQIKNYLNKNDVFISNKIIKIYEKVDALKKELADYETIKTYDDIEVVESKLQTSVELIKSYNIEDKDIMQRITGIINNCILNLKENIEGEKKLPKQDTLADKEKINQDENNDKKKSYSLLFIVSIVVFINLFVAGAIFIVKFFKKKNNQNTEPQIVIEMKDLEKENQINNEGKDEQKKNFETKNDTGLDEYDLSTASHQNKSYHANTKLNDIFSIDLSLFFKHSVVKDVGFTLDVLIDIDKWVKESLKGKPVKEVGGYLLGKINKKDKYDLVVEQFVPARNVGYSDTCELNFDNSFFLDLLPVQEETNLETLGWFHTHPNHSVFLSGKDVNVHATFNKPFQIAMVVDPFNNQLGIFSRGEENNQLILNKSIENKASITQWSQAMEWVNQFALKNTQHNYED